MLLIIIPLMFALRWVLLMQKRRKMRLWGDHAMFARMAPDRSRWRPLIKFSLLMGAAALLIVMLARPQMGTKMSEEKRNGIEAIICLDISNSMLAEDVSPSRLDKSKLLVQNLVDHFTNDKIGLVVFAGNAFTQLPITADYVSAKMFLQNASPELIEEQGTDIGHAINIASESFTKQDNIGRAIIVITDGENHEEGSLEAAKEAAGKGMQVFVLGVGSDKGAPIPLGANGYMTDNTGNTVMTKLNEQMCREVAEAGKGVYIHVDNNSDAQKQLDEALSNMQRSEVSSVIYSEYEEQFQVLAFLVILILLAEALLMERKTSLQRRISIFKKRTPKVPTAVVLMLMLLVPTVVMAQSDRDYIRRGNRQHRQQQYDKAIGEYEKAVARNKENPVALFNLGVANMDLADKKETLGEKLQKDSLALRAFLQSAQLQKKDRNRRAEAYHNMGIIYQKHYYYFVDVQRQMKDNPQQAQNAQHDRHTSLVEAIKAYRQALRCNPKDDDTRYNLALCQYLLKKEPKNQNNQNQNNQNQQDDKSQEQQKDQNQNKQQQQQQQQQDDKMSRENAEALLQNANRQEQQTQEKLKRRQQSRRPAHLKNW